VWEDLVALSSSIRICKKSLISALLIEIKGEMYAGLLAFFVTTTCSSSAACSKRADCEKERMVRFLIILSRVDPKKKKKNLLESLSHEVRILEGKELEY